MMDMPSVVVIDAVEYRVNQNDEVMLNENHQEIIGDVDCNKALIRIGSNANGEGRKPQTLMHEIVHALMFERGIDGLDDENTVDSLASGIINMIRYNPRLVDYVKRSDAE